MEYDEFVGWTQAQVRLGRFTEAQRERLLWSRRRFDADSWEPGTVGGYVGERRLVAESVTGILAMAEEERKDAESDDVLYFEPIGRNPFGI